MTSAWVTMLSDSNMLLVAFIVGLLTLAASLLFFRSIILFVGELILFILLLTIGENAAMGIIISIIQFALFIYVLYRLKAAIDRNYALVLEKIHKKEPEITKNGNGSERTFL